mmetsp:Transcript_1638/g.4922  ORF Transcript_1638/g.4922 Transcript_1638/m.4922 type:complete len:239 (+) Transcript_1638:141-857(+)|eukprot:CAMPEP_0198730586 /NCGR_PEP_ID=MMETSP1475-20131203/25203_1 /TAXON_ID= ORGANISM="Unidentified sp., Strain CCMP1999" /NCGR_SAMPLE_ID=MMETSP1475 /ASSEMBLY_ACC=CAM_ASM_001111 /LENGTH=238 /DNA_ID=CAMNT_0044493405 /DNA_START=55 /DNA_END=771 /DNA_ORIENTATION=+
MKRTVVCRCALESPVLNSLLLTARKDGVCNNEVVWSRYFYVCILADCDLHGLPQLFDNGDVIGDLEVVLDDVGEAVDEKLLLDDLRSLDLPEPFSLYGAQHKLAVFALFDGRLARNSQHGGTVLSSIAKDVLDLLVGDQRTRGIMDAYQPRAVRGHLQPIVHGVLSLLARVRKDKTFVGPLEIGREGIPIRFFEDDDYLRDFPQRQEQLQRSLQDCLPLQVEKLLWSVALHPFADSAC